MRAFQFWLLVLGATLVSLLMMKNVFIAREFNRQQHELIHSEQMANAEPQYENAWKTLAMHIYEKSKADPALAQVLKNNDVQVRSDESTAPAPDSSATPSPGTSPMPSVPAKAPTATPATTP
jgi:hypothetical protein